MYDRLVSEWFAVLTGQFLRVGRAILFALFFGFVAACSCMAKELVLEYEVQTLEYSQKHSATGESNDSKKNATPGPVDSGAAPLASAANAGLVLDHELHSKYVIGIGESYFYIERDGGVDLYRFDDKTISHLDPSSKVYSNMPLSAVLSFREAELRNRMMMGQLLGSIGVKSELPNDVELQSLFSLKFPGQIGGPQIEREQSGDRTKFVCDGKVLASYQSDDRPLEPEFRNSFERLLTYCATLYPGIGHRICENGRVLKTFEFETNDLPRMKTSTSFKLSSASERELPKYGPEFFKDYTRKYGDQVARLKEKLSSLPPYVPAERLLDAIAQANKELSNGEKFNAFLCLVQYQIENYSIPKLTVPEPDIQKQIDQIQQKVSDDPSVRKFKCLMGDGELKDAEAAVDWLTKQETTGLKYGHVIDVWKASVLAQGGKSGESSKICFDALLRNPYMQFGYYILGYSYYVGYQTPTAWEIWAFGKTVQPQPNMFSQAMDGREARLIKSYPQYY